MKEIKKKLKVWNKEVFGRLETNKASALEQVDFWDRVESERNLTVEEAVKKGAKDSFKKWVLLEEAHWRQHSREIWLREGDRNTGFFHRMASAHRRNNVMGRIKVNGEWLVEEQEVREGVVNSFQQLLSEDMVWQADIGNIQVGCISQQEAESLEIPFAEIEIHSALMEMNGDKAPGPDGFTVAFWQNAWDFTKEEIMEMFKEFHEHNPLSFKKWALGPSGWDGCGAVSSAKFSILVNGVPAGFFPSTRGLRQGDPLSPYLFVMGMEILDVLIRRAVEGGYLSGATFGVASGLRINLAKSEIIPVGEVEEILEMAAELGCRVGSLPSHYLGLPLGVPNRASSMWDGVEERSGGDLRFGKDSTSQRGEDHSYKRVPWLVCQLPNVYLPYAQKNNGGLGLRRIATLNRALLGQVDLEAFLEDDSVIWRQGRNGLFRVKEAYRLLDKPNATVSRKENMGG
ncbi:hypothetical protein CK203_005639 [Vitis vinifera]|uniref:Reverse transcriptase domain-containing protein n=1 Tax=Vitis vinifera TaxID=29760 RepID=A0A438K4D3_VITVI|nr:hypothetical protein CK203_005639 [Vitis vinifera]